MGTINANNLKVGSVFKEGEDSYLVLKYNHIKKGRGQATIKVKVKNILSSSITEMSFTNEQKVHDADVEKKTVQYLYEDGQNGFFMDASDYSQFQIELENFENEKNFMKEGDKVVATFLEGNPIALELPKSVDLEVIETSDAVAGNTANNAMKDAILETGFKIQVPLFINTGDRVKVNTESSSYVSRVK